jgi:hypothetical protein
MARVLVLAAGIVLLAAAGGAFLTSLTVLIPGGETNADTWLGAGVLLGAALLVGGVADLLIIKGVRPSAPRPSATALERPAPSRTAPTRMASAAVQRGGADQESTLAPALHEVGFQLFGVAGGLLADVLTAFLRWRRRARGAPAPPVHTSRPRWTARVRAGLRTTVVVILLVLWAGAIGGLVGVVEGLVRAPATTWNSLTTDPTLQLVLGVCVGAAVVGGLFVSRRRRG